MATLYQKYASHLQKLADISNSIAVLSWDKEVNMPTKGAHFRAQQIATLSGIYHDEFTSKEFGAILTSLSKRKYLKFKEKRNVQITSKEYQKSSKFSKDFVIKRSLVTSKAFEAWLQARAKNDFSLFEDALDNLIVLKREEAKILSGSKNGLYDSLMDEYEPGLTTETLDTLFTEVKDKLIPFINKIKAQKNNSNKFLFKKYDKSKQWSYGMFLVEALGYDLKSGRQDISMHPFTTSFSPQDVRITTRIDENDFANMTFSSIHEVGHGLYEQGLPIKDYGLPSGTYAGLAIHESQSRLWENNVCRSLGFWEAFYPGLRRHFKENLKKVGLNKFYKGINRIEPNLIRTEADELHYHLHVLIRYEIEKEMIEGNITASEVKLLWNQKYKDYLGLDVPDDNQGILQDVHWAHGSIGYFATYSLGSFYAAQFYEKAKKSLKNFDQNIARGNTAPLLEWLKVNIHQYGKTYEAEQLCKRITGKTLNFSSFMNYVVKKYSKIYNL